MKKSKIFPKKKLHILMKRELINVFIVNMDMLCVDRKSMIKYQEKSFREQV